MILAILSFNVLLYSISVWAKQDYYWMFPLNEWDLNGLLFVVFLLNFAFSPISVLLHRTIFNKFCFVSFNALSFYLLTGV